MRKRILLIARNFKAKGGKRAGESFVATLVSTISQYGNFEVTVLSSDDMPQNDEEETGFNVTRVPSIFVPKGVPLPQFYTDRWQGDKEYSFIKAVFWKNVDLARVVRQARKMLPKVDVIHWFDVFSPLNNLFIAWSKRYAVKNYATHFSLFKRYPLNYQLLKASFIGFNEVIATTRALEASLYKDVKLTSGKIQHIPLGVDLDFYRPAPNKDKRKEAKGISTNHKVISWFGPIENCIYDDFCYLLNSAKHMQKNLTPSIFIFAFKDTIPASVAPSGDNVRFYNNLGDIREILDITDIVVLPGTREVWQVGLPLTIVEALASGVPVIATKSKGVDEAVADGFNGILVERLEDIPGAVSILCQQEDKLKEISKNARAFAEKQFDINKVAQAYADLWQR